MELKQRLTNDFLQCVRDGASQGAMDMFLMLGADTPCRARIAYNILSKALNYSQLVRVQRTATRNGRSYVTYVWVRPEQVTKSDIVISGRKTLDQWRTAHKEGVSAAKQDAKDTRSIPGWDGDLNSMSSDTMKALHNEVSKKKRSSVTMESMTDSIGRVYSEYGYSAAVAYANAYARDAFAYDEWTDEFADTNTRYAPELLAMVRYEWANDGYTEIRRTEKKALAEKPHGYEVFAKICGDVLHDMIDRDGSAVPDVIYRGLSYKHQSMDEYKNAEVGGTVTLGALSSFSGDEDIAYGFVEGEDGNDGIILKIETGGEVNGLYVDGKDGYDEDEYIVPDGAFEVREKEVEENEWGSVIVLTLQPAKGETTGENRKTA